MFFFILLLGVARTKAAPLSGLTDSTFPNQEGKNIYNVLFAYRVAAPTVFAGFDSKNKSDLRYDFRPIQCFF
jgi:hypothetical protein